MMRRKTMNKEEAAKKIQGAYRRYLTAKKKDVHKDKLLPARMPGKLTVPIRDEDTAALLLFSVDQNQVLFKEKGWASLFPEKEGIHIQLLQHYLNKGIDIRPWVLEAFLRKKIDKHALISLFQLEHFIEEFWLPHHRLQSSSSNPLVLFRIHENQALTDETKQYLLPYLMQHGHPYALADEQKKANYLLAMEHDLQQLEPIDNLSAILFFPDSEMFKIAYAELNVLDFSEITQPLKAFFELTAKKIGFPSFTLTPQSLEMLAEKLNQKVCAILKEEEGVTVQKNELLDYLEKHQTLFHVLFRTLKETSELIPIALQDVKEGYFATLFINSRVQNIWMKAATGKAPEDLLPMVPMLGFPDLDTVQTLKENCYAPIGLFYANLAMPTTVHDAICGAFAYEQHDSRFHYANLYFLLAHAKPLYDIQLKYVKAIRDTTHHHVTHAIVTILDGACPFFYDQYINQSAIEQIQESAFFPEPIENVQPATREYAFIVACDAIKNKKDYLNLLRQLPGTEAIGDERLFQIFLDNILDQYAEKALEKIYKHMDKIQNYSHSLGVFMCGLLQAGFKEEQVLSCCDKLHALEKEKLVEFKWNKMDGLMLNIGEQSFRFRDRKNDLRRNKTYPPSTMTRRFSDEKGWFEALTNAITSPPHPSKTSP